MPRTHRAHWKRATAPEFNDIPKKPSPPEDEEELTAEERAGIERLMLEELISAECALGTDYSDGPMSPQGCYW